ncbi:MAG: trypsin-like peptidase domain-containing protein [Leptospirales bacterium]
MDKKQWKISPIGLTNLVLFVFLIGAFFSPFIGNCKESTDSQIFASEQNPLLQSNSVVGAIKLQQALREIYEEVSPAVVRIETEQIVKVDPIFKQFFGTPKERTRQGLGSGFIISSDGFIVTNYHVVKGVDKITVKLQNGNFYEAKLIGSDEISDIVLLKIEAKEEIKVVHLGNSDETRVGDFGIAIGNPFGLQSTFTFGVISSTGQDIHAADGQPRIQTDAAINPGNSGGPLLNIKGEVVGINQMIYSQSGGSVGIGFAIPINYAKDVIEVLKSGKTIKPGYIGVVIEGSISDRTRNKLKLEDNVGLLISHVNQGSPAWEAGLRSNDFIIKVNGDSAESLSVLKSTVLRKGAGAIIDIEYIRDGKIYKTKVTLKEIPRRR